MLALGDASFEHQGSAMIPRRKLSRPAGLPNRPAFLRVQGSGQRFKGRLMAVLVAPCLTGEAERIGYTVSRKVGNAVVRNRVKRRLREIVRCEPDLLSPTCEHVIIAFPAAATADFAALQQEASCLLRRARAWALRRASSSA